MAPARFQGETAQTAAAPRSRRRSAARGGGAPRSARRRAGTTPPPAAPLFWIDHPFPPSAPYPPTVPNYRPTTPSTLATKLAPQFGVPASKVNVVCAGKDTSRRRRLDSSSTLTVTVETTTDNQAAVTTAVQDGFADAPTASRTLGLGVTSKPDVTIAPPIGGGSTGDPHIHFAHGGRADYRGEDNAIVSFLSAPGVALNVKTEDVVYNPPWWPGTTIDGSFITEAPSPSPLLPGETPVTVRLAPRRTSSHAWAALSASGPTPPSSPRGSPSSTRASTSSPAPAAATPSPSGLGRRCDAARSSPSSRTTRLPSSRRPLSRPAIDSHVNASTEPPLLPPPLPKASGWTFTVGAKSVEGWVSGPKHQLDVNIHAEGDAAARSLPHGPPGQESRSEGVV